VYGEVLGYRGLSLVWLLTLVSDVIRVVVRTPVMGMEISDAPTTSHFGVLVVIR